MSSPSSTSFDEVHYSMAEASKEELLPVPIPEAMRPILERLQSLQGLSRSQVLAIVFIVRLIDSMHACFHATFISLAYAEKLRTKLKVEHLDLELDVYATRWSWRHGLVSSYHRISWDYDSFAMFTLSQIARSVINGKVMPEEGLVMLNDFKESSPLNKFELAYRSMPGRILVLPLMAMSCCGSYFGGNWVDVGFATLAGLVVGCIHYLVSIRPQVLAHVEDTLVSIVTAMLSTMAFAILPDAACFSAIVLGTLFWFLYGTAFMVSLYEIGHGQLVTGVSRLALALLNSFVLAFGASIGLWIAAYGGTDRFEIAARECSEITQYRFSDLWFLLLYPLSGVASLMQFRMSMRHWHIGLVVQMVAVGSQYAIGTAWNQPSFIANVIPAYVTTLAAHILLVVGYKVNLTELRIHHGAFTDSQDDSPVDTKNEWVRHGTQGGYTRHRVGHHHCDRSDLWFCLLPAMYLLVPGSGVLSDAFRAIWGSETELVSSFAGVFVIGLSQALGIHLAFATLEAATSWVALLSSRRGRVDRR